MSGKEIEKEGRKGIRLESGGKNEIREEVPWYQTEFRQARQIFEKYEEQARRRYWRRRRDQLK